MHKRITPLAPVIKVIIYKSCGELFLSIRAMRNMHIRDGYTVMFFCYIVFFWYTFSLRLFFPHSSTGCLDQKNYLAVPKCKLDDLSLTLGVSKFYVKDLIVSTGHPVYFLPFYQSKLNANQNSYKKYNKLMSSKLPITIYLVQSNPTHIFCFIKRVYHSSLLKELCNWSPFFRFCCMKIYPLDSELQCTLIEELKGLKFLVNENASANKFQKKNNIHTTSSEW